MRKNTQRHTSEPLRLPRKMTMEVSKALRLPQKMELICWKFEALQKYCASHTKLLSTSFDAFADTRKCQEVPRLPSKTTLQPPLTP